MKAPKYRLGHLASVARQVRELAKRAATLGIGDWLKKTLEEIADKRQTIPLQIGDPVHHPKKKGAFVRVAIFEPVHIRYVVYRHEKIVIWLELKPLSRFFPE